MRRGRGRRTWFSSGLLHITLIKLTSVQFSSVPQPVGCACLSSVFIFYVSITACQLVCLSHQCDLHLLRLVALLLLSAGVLFGWRRSSSYLQENIINVNLRKRGVEKVRKTTVKAVTEMPYFSSFDKQHIVHFLPWDTNLLSPKSKEYLFFTFK